jgi:hypothetical protein
MRQGLEASARTCGMRDILEGNLRASQPPGALERIAILTEDDGLPDSEKVQLIRALLSTQEAKRLLEKDNLAELKEALFNELGDDEYYSILAAKVDTYSESCQSSGQRLLGYLFPQR